MIESDKRIMGLTEQRLTVYLLAGIGLLLIVLIALDASILSWSRIINGNIPSKLDLCGDDGDSPCYVKVVPSNSN